MMRVMSQTDTDSRRKGFTHTAVSTDKFPDQTKHTKKQDRFIQLSKEDILHNASLAPFPTKEHASHSQAAKHSHQFRTVI